MEETTPRVVVVDDDPTNVSLLKILLELEGFTVTPTADLEEARAAADQSADAFVIDLHLARGESGLELVRHIRSGNTSAARNAVIIVTSGDHRSQQDAINAGADLFLFKPYPPNDLAMALSKLISSRKGDVI
ncbi:MAG: response regulator transcription factor [Anaerolineae bacterium]